MILAIIAMFVLFKLDSIYVTVTDVLKDSGSTSDIFTTPTSIALFCTMLIIILERYINRANVIETEED
jgi:hypothetical protein